MPTPPTLANHSGMPAGAARPPRVEAAIAWLAMAALVLLVSVVMVLADQLRTRALDEAEGRAVDTARVLAEHAARAFDAADLLVVRAAEESRDRDWSAIEHSHDLWGRLQREVRRFPFIDAAWLNDETGRLRLTTYDFPTPASTVADREFFRVHVDGPDRPYVSELIVGRVTGERTFLLTRRLLDQRGSFRGIASVTIDASYFERFYRQTDLPYAPTILLFRTDRHDVLVRNTSDAPQSGEALPGAVSSLVLRQPVSGRMRSEHTIIAHRALSVWPVGVAVVLDADRIERAAWATLWPYLLPAAGGGLALLGLAAFGFRQARAARTLQQRLEERVHERTASLEAALAQRNDALDQKDLLMQEVNHRVKNSLQVVSGLLTLQSQSIADAEARRQIEDAGRRVRAISDIHRLLYRGKDVQAIPFHDYLTELCRDLERSALEEGGDWRLELDVEPAEIATDRAVPLGLIANELVMNAIKHAYPADGGPKPIAVALRREQDGRLRLIVADRGIGLPAGFEWRGGNSLGMRVIHALAGQLGATVEARSDGSGASFSVTVPLGA